MSKLLLKHYSTPVISATVTDSVAQWITRLAFERDDRGSNPVARNVFFVVFL